MGAANRCGKNKTVFLPQTTPRKKITLTPANSQVYVGANKKNASAHCGLPERCAKHHRQEGTGGEKGFTKDPRSVWQTKRWICDSKGVLPVHRY